MKKNKKESNVPEKKELEIRSKHSWTMKAHLDENGIKTGDWDINVQTPIQILNASDEDINNYFFWLQDAMAVGLLSMIDILYLVKSTPNDKELGEKIRSFFYNAKLLPSSYDALEEYNPDKEKK